uniref:Uncharacterized protein ycf33 n=1 Tax=Rhodochaete parvula TaxID=110510 RepID=A0A1X9PV27_9RHOD|nr:conserved hypothetical plastid protein [Rhodochaete parvula]
MPTFWENIIRLIRFFVSSVTGLIFIILSPFVNLIEKRNTLYLVLILFLIILIIVYKILEQMLGINLNTNI